jgi:hypothetical protein
MQSNPRLFSFTTGNSDRWRIVRMDTIVGPDLETAKRLEVVAESGVSDPQARWILHDITRNERSPEKLHSG